MPPKGTETGLGVLAQSWGNAYLHFNLIVDTEVLIHNNP